MTPLAEPGLPDRHKACHRKPQTMICVFAEHGRALSARQFFGRDGQCLQPQSEAVRTVIVDNCESI
jgi:hypothetical protein